LLHLYVRHSASIVGVLLLLAAGLFAYQRTSQSGAMAPAQAAYANNCASCHGVNAEGTTRAGSLLALATQADFVARWQAMHSSLYANMSAADRDEVWSWVQQQRAVATVGGVVTTQPLPAESASPTTELAPQQQASPTTEQLPRVPESTATVRPVGDVALGGSLYAQECARCHGAKAEGSARGPALAAITDQPTFLAGWERQHASLFAGVSEEQRAAVWAWLVSVR
jgi:mono/diheme cytochrome c family protein